MKPILTAIAVLLLAPAALGAGGVPEYTINEDATRQFSVAECIIWDDEALEEPDPLYWVQPYPGGNGVQYGVSEYYEQVVPGAPRRLYEAATCTLAAAMKECLDTSAGARDLAVCVDALMATAPQAWDDGYGENPRVSAASDPIPLALQDLRRGDAIYVHGFPSILNHVPI